MLPLVPILKQVVQEGQQLFTAKDIFDKKQNELVQLIQSMTQSLDQVEYFDNIQEDLYSNEQKLLIKQCKDLLHQSEQLLQTLPSNLTFINGYFYIKSKNYRELLQCLDDLNKINSQMHELEMQSLEVLKTVVIPNFSRKQSFQQQIFQIQIVLKLRAPKLIKEIFDQYPRHLKSEYHFKIEMDGSDSHKNVFHFQRKEFIKLQQVQKETKIYTLSKKQHCSLELRNIQQHSNSQQNTFISNPKLRASQITSIDNFQLDQDYQNLLKLFLIVNGQNGITIIRNQKTIMHIGSGEECELLEKDQIVILQDSNQQPQISYMIQRIMIQLL